MAEATTETAPWDVNCQGVWKIFGASGAREQEVLKAARSEGLDRNEIKKKYGSVLAVANVDLQIAHGEIFCIIGLSGSGKSTLIRHINRLINPTAGDIWVGGLRINALSASALRRARAHDIGMVFQNMALLPHRTVRDNVVLGLELRGLARDRRNDIAEEKLELVGLQAWADHMPHELSGGMQQRVGLARALAADPRVLLMDEPFSALDPLIRRQLQSLFIELSAKMKKTTLFITHDIDEAIRVGNRIAVMHDGVIVQSGTAEDLVARPANDYVASFVQGVSRLAITRAHTIMQPWQEPPPFDSQTCPQAHAVATLGELLRLAVDRGTPIKIVEDGEPVGFITRQALLAGLDQQGKRS